MTLRTPAAAYSPSDAGNAVTADTGGATGISSLGGAIGARVAAGKSKNVNG